MPHSTLDIYKIQLNFFRVINEPGDCTHYEFLIFKYSDMVHIIGDNSFPSTFSISLENFAEIVVDNPGLFKEMCYEEYADKLYAEVSDSLAAFAVSRKPINICTIIAGLRCAYLAQAKEDK